MKWTLTVTVERVKEEPAETPSQAQHPPPAKPTAVLPAPATEFRAGPYL